MQELYATFIISSTFE